MEVYQAGTRGSPYPSTGGKEEGPSYQGNMAQIYHVSHMTRGREEMEDDDADDGGGGVAARIFLF